MITVVYHAFLVSEWKDLVKEQIERLILSGLYEYCDEIFMTVNSEEHNKEEFIELISEYDKIKYEFNNEGHAEYPAIKKIKEISKEKDTKILYFHTKGVSNFWERAVNKEKISHEKVKNVKSWRECMEYFLIDNWRLCVEKLDEYDNVGVTCNNGWYSGNFWWSKSEHIRKTNEVGKWGRWDYENWLNAGISGQKNYEFYHTNLNLFLTNLEKEWYKLDREEIDKEIIIQKAFYGTAPFEIDEGYYGQPLSEGIDVTKIVEKLLQKEDNKLFNFRVCNESMEVEKDNGLRKFLVIEFKYKDSDKIMNIGVSQNNNILFKP